MAVRAFVPLFPSVFALAASAVLGAKAQQPSDTSAHILYAAPVVAADTPRVRRRAVVYSDAYNTRLTIHRIGSYTMLPLFAGEWVLGDRLLNGTNPPSWVKPTHVGVAGALGVLFTVNTVTGAWNLWDSREDPAGRTRRYVHAGLMLASDGGFLWTAAIAGDAKHSHDAGRRHRNVALGSIGLSTIGTALMWFWKD
jgi:hypothetical protein